MNKHQFFEQFYPSYEQHEAKIKALEAAWKEISSLAPQAHNTTRIGNYEIMLNDWSGRAPKGNSYEVDGKWYYDHEAAMSIQFPDGFRLPMQKEWVDICGLLDNKPIVLQYKLSLGLNGYHNGSSVNSAGIRVYYWSSTDYDAGSAYVLNFNGDTVNPQSASLKNLGFAVRGIKNNI